ncbi:MAG: FtsQ-type POTRA domain-containing protein [Sphingomonadales bacterium]|nr:FtsQ-type POTRA domain-containing protein [Sphingomonadales bacterium]MDE2567573.1 FtsQ-type POTRA domain-containing protein [Sphingomonadales bacterium]
MAAQTIKRGGKGVRRAAASRGTKRKVQTAKKRTGSALDSLMRFVPLSEDALHRLVLAVILAVAAVLVWLVASYAGLPALAQQQFATVAGDAGFAVKRVEVRGVNRMNELKIYEKVLGQRDQAMPNVDVDALRNDLLGLSWVEDARVSRQLPDTLVVDIVERVPHAVLQKADKMVLIDQTGHELEAVAPAAARGMLVLSGMGAGQQVPGLDHLLDAAPALKPQVASAEWVGNRRWNLTFKSGQVLALPEGDAQSASALLAFARMDGVNRLLGGEVAYFDMRAPDRVYMRIPGRAAEVSQIAAAKAAASKE